MKEAGLQEVENYVSLLHNTVAQFIAARPIMDLCMASERRLGSQVANKWWDQELLDLDSMRTAAREGEQEEEGTDGTATEMDE